MPASANLPNGMPFVIEWQVGTVILTSLPRREVEKDEAPRSVVKPYVPIAATGWRLTDETDWRPLSTLPAAWRAALSRPPETPDLHKAAHFYGLRFSEAEERLAYDWPGTTTEYDHDHDASDTEWYDTEAAWG